MSDKKLEDMIEKSFETQMSLLKLLYKNNDKKLKKAIDDNLKIRELEYKLLKLIEEL